MIKFMNLYDILFFVILVNVLQELFTISKTNLIFYNFRNYDKNILQF